MRAAPAALALALLVAPACSSSAGGGPAYPLAQLRNLLVATDDVRLPGYLASTPTGEQQPHTATAIRYFTAADGFRQLTVTLMATRDASAARVASARSVTTAIDSLRGVARSSPSALGSNGRRIAGRTKGYGALQDSIFFTEGSVAVGVTLSSSTPGRPPDLVTGVARIQDAVLKKAA